MLDMACFEGVVGPTWVTFWGQLGSSLGAFGGLPGRLGPIFRRLEALLDRLVDHLGGRMCLPEARLQKWCSMVPRPAGVRPSSAGVPPVAGALSGGVPPQTPPGGH